jgi:hypothetical protein
MSLTQNLTTEGIAAIREALKGMQIASGIALTIFVLFLMWDIRRFCCLKRKKPQAKAKLSIETMFDMDHLIVLNASVNVAALCVIWVTAAYDFTGNEYACDVATKIAS